MLKGAFPGDSKLTAARTPRGGGEIFSPAMIGSTRFSPDGYSAEPFGRNGRGPFEGPTRSSM